MSTPPPITYPPSPRPGMEIKDVDINIKQVVASMTATPLYGDVPFEVVFDCTGSVGQRIIFSIAEDQYSTRMNSPETGWVFNYTFTTEGQKTVTITVVAGANSATQTLTILANPSPPEGDNGMDNTYVIRLLSFGSVPDVPSNVEVEGEMV